MRTEFIVLIAAVVLGAAALVFNQIQTRSDAATQSTVSVVMVTTQLGRDGTLSESNLAEMKMPREYAHFQSIPYEAMPQLFNQKVRNAIQPGQQLLWTDLEEPENYQSAIRNLGEILKQNHTIVSLPIDTMGGFIQPGSNIDLYLLFPDSPGVEPVVRELGGDPVTMMLDLELETGESAARLKDRKLTWMVLVAQDYKVFSIGTTMRVSENSRGGGSGPVYFEVDDRTFKTLTLLRDFASKNGGTWMAVPRSGAGMEKPKQMVVSSAELPQRMHELTTTEAK